MPVAAGYHADGVNIGRSTLVVRMSDGHGHSFTVGIARPSVPCDGWPLCTADLSAYGYSGTVPAAVTFESVPARVLAGLKRIRETPRRTDTDFRLSEQKLWTCERKSSSVTYHIEGRHRQTWRPAMTRVALRRARGEVLTAALGAAV